MCYNFRFIPPLFNMPLLLKGYGGVVRRDLIILCRHPFDWLLPLSFFLLVNLLFAVAAGGNAALLARMAPAVIVSAALLAALLTHDSILRPDYENGFLEQALLSSLPLPLFALAKATTHWLTTGLLFTLLLPLVAGMLGINGSGILALLLSMPVASATLSLFTVFAAALTMGQRSHLLAALLVLPLTIPVLIFCVASVDAASAGQTPLAAAAFLAALALLTLTLLPLATAGVLRTLGAQ